MNPDAVVELHLKPAFRECEQHLKRLRYAAGNGARLFPMTAEKYNRLADTDVATLDQMLFRFGKLQDAISQRVLPAILKAGQDWMESETFLDKLNRLEKLGVISSTEEWIRLRDLRNNATHEYLDQPEVNAENLNKLYASIQALQRNLAKARKYAVEHFALS